MLSFDIIFIIIHQYIIRLNWLPTLDMKQWDKCFIEHSSTWSWWPLCLSVVIPTAVTLGVRLWSEGGGGSTITAGWHAQRSNFPFIIPGVRVLLPHTAGECTSTVRTKPCSSHLIIIISQNSRNSWVCLWSNKVQCALYGCSTCVALSHFYTKNEAILSGYTSTKLNL